MKKKLTTILAFVLVAVLSVAGTLAYLTATSKVTNTFTVGEVDLTVDETAVDENGEPIPDADPVDGNEYKLIPGKTYTKDPTLHIGEDSEPCWIFAKIENGLGDAATLKMVDGWSLLEGSTDVYVYADIVAPGTDVKVFTEFTFDGEADPAEFEDAQIVVTGYAVQAEGFDTAEDAWSATFGK